MSKKEYAPHEGLFLKVFKNKENTKHFLQKHLPKDISQHIDWDNMYLESTSYLDDQLRKHFSDLVFSVQLKGQEFAASKIYLLFEHKSTSEGLVAIQILRYMALQWKEMFDQGKTTPDMLPPIIPIVIYQGRESWRPRTSFKEIVEIPSEAFRTFIPDFSFAFFNVKNVDRVKVQQNVILKFYVEMIRALDSPELKDLLPQLTKGFYESLGEKTALEYIEIFFKYLVKSTEIVDKEDYKRALEILPEGGDKVMTTLAEQWMQEGRQEVLAQKDKWISEAKSKAETQTYQENLLEVLSERFGTVSNSLISRIKSINSQESLKMLFKQCLRVNSLEEFKEQVHKAMDN